MKKKVLTMKDLEPYNLKSSGKVREKYSVPNYPLLVLLLTTDRVSIFDVIIGVISGKGVVLNCLQAFWKNFFRKVIPNDVVTNNDALIAKYYGYTSVSSELQGRLCIVRRAEVIPIECIVRFVMDGSLLKEYRKKNGYKDGAYVWGIWFREGLRKGSRLDEPVFTPSTKAPIGKHDVNISYDEMGKIIESWLKEHPKISGFSWHYLAQELRSTSLDLASMGKKHAAKKGYTLVDTKFEFGFIYDEKQKGYDLCLIDEVLTPDSSRFKYKGKYQDKQILRDYFVNVLGWDKESLAPPIPRSVAEEVIDHYQNYSAVMTA